MGRGPLSPTCSKPQSDALAFPLFNFQAPRRVQRAACMHTTSLAWPVYAASPMLVTVSPRRLSPASDGRGCSHAHTRSLRRAAWHPRARPAPMPRAPRASTSLTACCLKGGNFRSCSCCPSSRFSLLIQPDDASHIRRTSARRDPPLIEWLTTLSSRKSHDPLYYPCYTCLYFSTASRRLLPQRQAQRQRGQPHPRQQQRPQSRPPPLLGRPRARRGSCARRGAGARPRRSP